MKIHQVSKKHKLNPKEDSILTYDNIENYLVLSAAHGNLLGFACKFEVYGSHSSEFLVLKCDDTCRYLQQPFKLVKHNTRNNLSVYAFNELLCCDER